MPQRDVEERRKSLFESVETEEYVALVFSLQREMKSDCAAVNKVKRSLLYWGDRGKTSFAG